MPRFLKFFGPAALGVLLVAAPSLPAQEEESLEGTRATLAKWMETQQVISREKRDWQLARDVLEQRIALIEGEIEALRARIQETEASITEVDRKRLEMVRENEDLKKASASLEEAIGELEQRTTALLGSAPEPARERVSLLSHKIPRDPASTELTLGARFQNVIGILNEVNKFNRDITVASEIRTLPGGQSAEVKVLYLGLGQAYFVTPSGTIAGVGLAAESGWEWRQADELAPRISRAIAIIQNEQVPAFVPLPVEIR